MYGDQPYACEVGHVGEAAGVATSAEVIEGHDVPPDVLTSTAQADELSREALEGINYCYNDTGCGVVGQLKDFKVCPLCKIAWYCGDACQKLDWKLGGARQRVAHFVYTVGHVRALAQ
jgi:hypothetical protein